MEDIIDICIISTDHLKITNHTSNKKPEKGISGSNTFHFRTEIVVGNRRIEQVSHKRDAN